MQLTNLEIELNSELKRNIINIKFSSYQQIRVHSHKHEKGKCLSTKIGLFRTIQLVYMAESFFRRSWRCSHV